MFQTVNIVCGFYINGLVMAIVQNQFTNLKHIGGGSEESEKISYEDATLHFDTKLCYGHIHGKLKHAAIQQ